ncbi:MAG TPA: agmatinase [Bacteroidia bacterium]|nr:agmatinase [Bacteroidia bacterium]
MKALETEKNFLGIEDENLYSYEKSRFVIQQIPYEHTSSYLQGSAKGPAAMIAASHYVEFYDEVLDMETFRHAGIATLPEINFNGKTDADAVELIEAKTQKLLIDKKFVVSFGAEHTVTLGLAKAHAKKFGNLSVLQIDAHSDLRDTYHGNKFSHACVMARVHELGLNLVQIGIRAQCKEEAELIKSSKNISTFYAHQIRADNNWISKATGSLTENVYITMDADGFDPSVVPAVGTAEPGGLFWEEVNQLLLHVVKNKNVVGFDIVEIAPTEGQILSEYTMAKLAYRLIGYIVKKNLKL